MNNNTTYNTPKFRAMTSIKVSNNCLSKDEIKTLTKMGQKIGSNTDRISFNVMNYNNNSLGITHKAEFYAGENTLQATNSKVAPSGEINPFQYIKEKMSELNNLYNQTFSK